MKKKLVIGIAVVMVFLVLVLLIGRLTDINAPRSTTTPNALSQATTTPSALPTQTPTPTPASPVVQPKEEQPYYEVGFPLARGIYHFRNYSKCWIKPEGYDYKWRSIPVMILGNGENNDIVFKLDPPEDVPVWIIVQCVKAEDYNISQDSTFEVKMWEDQYAPTTLVRWDYMKGDHIAFSIWFWIGPE
jgi:hypothetical protein